MAIKEQSPNAIAAELGQRLKQARLNADLTQIQVADSAGVSRKSVLNAEKGQTQLETFVAIMGALNLLQQLEQFLPVQAISPIQLAKLHGKKRQRATGTNKNTQKTAPKW